MIQSGTTTYADMYYFEEEIAKVTKEAGLRGVLGQTIIQFPVADAKTPAEALARTEAFLKRVRQRRSDRPRDRAALDVHAGHRDAQSRASRWPTVTHAPVLIHLAETADEVKTSREKHKATPDALSRVDWLLGSTDARRARCLVDARGYRRSWRAVMSACRTIPRAT